MEGKKEVEEMVTKKGKGNNHLKEKEKVNTQGY